MAGKHETYPQRAFLITILYGDSSLAWSCALQYEIESALSHLWRLQTFPQAVSLDPGRAESCMHAAIQHEYADGQGCG